MGLITLSKKPVRKRDKILIVGSWLFGLTSALELRKRGYDHVTVFDRTLPPAPDGPIVDTSRLIRADCADPFYSKMAFEAMEQWEADWGK
ncbi:hypothetical protein ANOM_002685 [Aspergillus nomiae NRRL 13137]|uniref:Uncharacterized protein n=1 Tax=Aspergillus nomiae NRRL (strain ATCC 15546 / NRRL 13137 / CBS 260.88 / M93) TaxID=1509407 RepID=A0A0L1JAV1_ASPN3|nr:uncharacterized protein ANOM_002685 [Aspergillus nomiae NRRL 13137]KNG88538.1 hypothetical protein ANOM_002685 [Aspergillus nomiae NRRL 13137]